MDGDRSPGTGEAKEGSQRVIDLIDSAEIRRRIDRLDLP